MPFHLPPEPRHLTRVPEPRPGDLALQLLPLGELAVDEALVLGAVMDLGGGGFDFILAADLGRPAGDPVPDTAETGTEAGGAGLELGGAALLLPGAELDPGGAVALDHGAAAGLERLRRLGESFGCGDDKALELVVDEAGGLGLRLRD
jgi:hypothetical protein